ncbi:MAG: phosphoribosyl-ATP diphosphatase [Pseudomonadota bacterium]|nr:phosphoribosyl-ATP diphosphatase [Pseudomonadota bacterium]|tara:strand:+ start:430 stop:744 length:315 start_codon:yes stop_codon:yes gene_type:complete
MTNILKKLEDVIKERKDSPEEESYVSSLNKKGISYTGEKVLEEAKELVDATNSESTERVISEAADLWFHSIVLLSMRNLSSNDILLELEKRFGISGITEKESRK